MKIMLLRALRSHRVVLGTALAWLGLLSQTHGAYTHALTKLGLPQPKPPGWSVIYVYGVSENHVIGTGNLLPDNGIRGYTWNRSSGEWTTLPLLPGGDQIRALAVNKSGQVVGYGTAKTGVLSTRAILFENGVVKNLGTLGASPYLNADSGGDSSIANAINELGQIVGNSTTSSGTGHAFLHEGGVMKDLGALGGPTNSSEAFAINNLGVAVGVSGTQAVAFENGSVRDLGPGKAYVINDQGTIAGLHITKPFLIRNGVRTDIPVPANSILKPVSINQHNQIILQGSVGVNPRCFLLDDAGLRDLSELADFTQDFMSSNMGYAAIDQEGRIYGFALNKSFANELFVLTPLASANPFQAIQSGSWQEIAGWGSHYGYQSGPGWTFSFHFGFLYSGYYPWLYHPVEGFLYALGGDFNNGGLYWYSPQLGSFLWVHTSISGMAYRLDNATSVNLLP